MNIEEEKQEKVEKRPQKFIKRNKYWNIQERRKYLFFICSYQDKILRENLSKKFFVRMASYINSKGKGPKECSEFHAQMKFRHKSFQGIVKQFQTICSIKDEEIKL